MRMSIALLALALLTGCSSSALSVDAVERAATGYRTGQGCPLGLRVEGLRASKPIGTSVGAPGSALGRADGVEIDCRYLSGRTPVEFTLVAVRKGTAVALLAPALSAHGELSMAQLRVFLDEPPEAGEVAVTPGAGTVAVSVLPANGGDIALAAWSSDGSLAGEELRTLTEEAAAGIRIT